ncbi:T6SS immunity protein Tli3 family protein, partial [Proteus sp. G2665]|uniref:T6SS immunity protein Tli3 family protein n=1 Tax=Proteus sp. G2665 TaxID=2698878 RepID=UPI0013775ECB
MQYKLSYFFILLLSTSTLSGCLSLKEKAAIKAEQDRAEQQRLIAEEIKSYGPPTVIYRIDDHRFFTLEKYNERRSGSTYYNNTQKGIHQELIRSSACRYQGRLIWATKRDDAFAFPGVLSRVTSRCAGTKTGCVNVILVTLDGGKNFRPTNGGFGIHTDHPGYYSSFFDIIVTDEGFYLGKTTVSRRKTNDELADPWWRVIYFDPTDSNYVHSSWGEEKSPPEDLKTPSGQTRFDCSAPSIYPIS